MPARSACTLSLLGAASLLVGCGTKIHHTPREYFQAGAPLPIEVDVDGVGDAPVTGVVRFRVERQYQFGTMEMNPRADQLYVMLPTESLEPGTLIEYYFDVAAGEELLGLGSPGRPFETTLLDRTSMMLNELRTRALATNDLNAVDIVFDAHGAPVEAPVIEYSLPNVPGVASAEMNPAGSGSFRLRVPAESVIAGTWRYAVVFGLEGQTYRVPENGFATFDVARAERDPQEQHARSPLDGVVDQDRMTDAGGN